MFHFYKQYMHLFPVNNTVSWVQSCQLLFVLSSVTRRKGSEGGKDASAATPRRWPIRRGCTFATVNDISNAGFPLGPAATPDSQTRASSCEPSVRCVRSQRAGSTPPPPTITAALVQAPIPPLSLSPWSHACLSATCLPRPLISAHAALSSCLLSSLRGFKGTNSSGRSSAHQWGQLCLVLSWCCMSLAVWDWAMLPCSFSFFFLPNPQPWPEFLWCHCRQLKHQSPGYIDSEKPQSLHPCHLTCHYPLLLRPGVEGFLFSFCSIILSSVIFICSAHQRNIFPGSFCNIWNWRRRIMSC